MNERYVLKLHDPLLRPGMTLEVGPFRKGIAVDVLQEALRVVREFNEADSARQVKTEAVGDYHIGFRTSADDERQATGS